MANTKIPAELSSTPSISDSGDATAITITSAEKVGINEDAPQQTLSVGVPAGSLSGISLTLNDTDLAAFLTSSSTGEVRFGGVYTNYFPTFYSHNSERMRITTDGDLLVRQTSADVYDTNTGGSVRQYWGNQFSAQNNGNSRVIIGSASNKGLVGGATVNASSKPIVNSYMAFESIDQTAGGEDGVIAFYTSSSGGSGTEKMRIDESGNVGIGATSSLQQLSVTSASGTVAEFLGEGGPHGLRIYGNDGGFGAIGHVSSGAYDIAIGSGGDVRIGTTTQGAATVLTVSGTSSGGNGAAAITGTADNGPALNLRKTSTTTDSSARFIQFAANSGSTAMGGIGGNGASNAQFITLSDEREKENITPVVSVLDKVMNLNVVSFDWIKHDEHIKAGFIAQNVEKYFPEYVVENVSNEGEEERKGTTGGMSAGYIAVLTKAIQEQQTIIEDLKARIETLEG